MSLEYGLDLWKRAVNALKSAETLLSVSSDDAAFHAVSAVFAIHNKSFSKHSAVRTAVHRGLVNTGLWSREPGEAFDALWELQDVGDYGGEEHVQKEDAENAVQAARKILQNIKRTYPKLEK